ncbi:MAG: RNA polymerase sigma factor [Pseudoflavonifractor sp.]|jgi:RNA polymerase sigma factor (sigma-70 family)
MGHPLLRTDKEITELYETHVDMVYRLCFTILKNRFDTEDAVQNTFIKLMHYSKPFDSPEHEKAWLIVTASNTCKDALRRASRRDEPLELQRDLLAPASADPAGNTVLDAVLALPLKYRAPVYLYYYE